MQWFASAEVQEAVDGEGKCHINVTNIAAMFPMQAFLIAGQTGKFSYHLNVQPYYEKAGQ